MNHLGNNNVQNRLATQNEADIIKTKIGQLLWISNQSRPDISCCVSILTLKLKNGKVSDLLTVNKVVSKVKIVNIANIKYQPLDDNI